MIHPTTSIFYRGARFLKIGKVILLGEYQWRRSPDELKAIFPDGDYDWFTKHLRISRNLTTLAT